MCNLSSDMHQISHRTTLCQLEMVIKMANKCPLLFLVGMVTNLHRDKSYDRSLPS
jgi:hypothetical protein